VAGVTIAFFYNRKKTWGGFSIRLGLNIGEGAVSIYFMLGGVEHWFGIGNHRYG
jgi:hypothetical protein